MVKILILHEDDDSKIWNLKFEGHETYTGCLDQLSNGRYRLRRYMYGETEIDGKDVPRYLRSFWPEATGYEMIRANGTRRPVKETAAQPVNQTLSAPVFNPPIRIN